MVGLRRGGWRRGTSRVTSRPASGGVTGATSVSSMTLIAGRIGMPMPSDQARTPFMPRSAVSVRLAQVNTGPEREGDDGDGDQVGGVGDPGAQRRVEDARRRWRAA